VCVELWLTCSKSVCCSDGDAARKGGGEGGGCMLQWNEFYFFKGEGGEGAVAE